MLLITAIFLISQNQKSFATHMAGADLTYRYLGNTQYEINYTFYRDCVGIPAQSSIDVTMSSATCGTSGILTLFPIPGTGQEITRVCPGASTTCSGGTEPGIQKWEYTGVATIANCPDWIFGTRECCRNGAITTLVDPLNEQMYVEATLDNSTSQNNSNHSDLPQISEIPSLHYPPSLPH